MRTDARLIAGAAVISGAIFAASAREFWAYVRVRAGPTILTYAEASRSGLAGYGYIRIADAHTNIRQMKVLARKDRDTREFGPWEAAYAPVVPDGDAQAAGRYHFLAFMPDAREDADVVSLAGGDGVEGFADTEFPYINPRHQVLVHELAGADGSACWIIRMRKPSWWWGVAMPGLGVFILACAVLIPVISNPNEK